MEHTWIIDSDGTHEADFQEAVRELLPPLFNSDNTHYFNFEWEKSIPKDPKHEIVLSKKALAIRAFIHVRDYESNSIDKDEAKWKLEAVLKKMADWKMIVFDTVHVLAVEDKHLKYAIDEEDNLTWKDYVTATHSRDYYNYDDFKKWHNLVLKVFKENTTEDTHKMFKGPFDSTKEGAAREEEWAAREHAGIQIVSYTPTPFAFYDVDGTFFRSDSTSLNVLFYAGDGTTGRPLGLEFDDIMGIVRVPLNFMENDVGSRLLYVQIDPTNRTGQPVDFVVLFEVVDTESKGDV